MLRSAEEIRRLEALYRRPEPEQASLQHSGVNAQMGAVFCDPSARPHASPPALALTFLRTVAGIWSKYSSWGWLRQAYMLGYGYCYFSALKFLWLKWGRLLGCHRGACTGDWG